MEKVQLSELDLRDLICDGVRSTVYRLDNNMILKLYKVNYLYLAKSVSVDIEKKILDASNMSLRSNIIKPKMAVYDGLNFRGDISVEANGVDFGTFLDGLNRKQLGDLSLFATIYNKLEEIVRLTPNIVYPDICSYENIFIGDEGKRIELIDYEGFQINDHPSLSFSTGLGDRHILNKSNKYCRTPVQNGIAPLYTKELDIRSLIFFYFRCVFNIDLRYNRDLEIIARNINLNNPNIMYKVWSLFEEDVPNEWLGEDVFRIADEYNLEILSNGSRRLVRK